MSWKCLLVLFEPSAALIVVRAMLLPCPSPSSALMMSSALVMTKDKLDVGANLVSVEMPACETKEGR